MDKWKLTHKWNMKEVKNLSYMDLAKMNLYERADLAQYLSDQYNRRVRETKRKGEIPYGLKKMKQDYEAPLIRNGEQFQSLAETFGYNIGARITIGKGKTKTLAPNFARDNYNAQHLLGYIMMMKTGLSWKSSTRKGWEEIIKKQDIMLFGGREVKRGAVRVLIPNKSLDEDTREMFWKAVDEIRRRASTELTFQYSEPLKESDFTTFFSDGDIDWNDLVSVTNALEAFINGDNLAFPEFVSTDGIGDPFGQVVELGNGGESSLDDSL